MSPWILSALSWLAGAVPFGNQVMRERQRAVEQMLDEIAPGALNFSDPDKMHKFCDQKLDHFDARNSRRWCQRFGVDKTHYHPGGPVFICLDGEDYPWQSALPHAKTCNNMYQLAPRFDALLVALEHRYYGGSGFDGVENFTVENLRWLSSRQALADASNFQSYLTQHLKLSSSTPWVSFGGSYSGFLAAFARKLYPEQFYAAVASSAPVQNEMNFQGYHDVVSSNLASSVIGGSPRCLSTVSEGHASLGRMAQTEMGRRLLEKKFGLCGHRVLENFDNLATWAGFGVILSTQYNSDRCEITSCNVGLLCGNLSAMRAAVDSDLDALVLLHEHQQEESVAKGGARTPCADVSWSAYLNSLMVTEKRGDATNQMRLWTYQICTEMGNFMTCNDGSNCPYTRGLLGMEIWFDMCEYVFGITPGEVQVGVRSFNSHYGGTTFDAGRVVFPNGQADPWHWLSVLMSPNPEIDTIMVQGASHCEWMQAPWDSMPQQQRAAQLGIQNRIAEWLDQAH